MASLQAGDVVTVTKIDRLGRSTRDFPELIDRIGKGGASFQSLGDPLWDSGIAQGRLLSTLLGAIAEFERELIRERTGAGRKRAMANGVEFGRKSKLSTFQRAEAIRRRGSGETLAAIAKAMRSTSARYRGCRQKLARSPPSSRTISSAAVAATTLAALAQQKGREMQPLLPGRAAQNRG
jgi:DNA invertase Pin-like site-specific DNA recombinase